MNVRETRGNKRKHTNNNNSPVPIKKSKLDEELIKKIMSINDGSSSDSDSNGDGNNNVQSQCINPLCDHKSYKKGDEVNKPPMIPMKINNIDDLIELGKMYHCKKMTEYCGLDLRILCNLVVPLTKLKNMVGMQSVKENMVNQIVFFLQNLDKSDNKCNECINCLCDKPCLTKSEGSMMNIVLYGPPGVGKTSLGAILGDIYNNMGIVKGDGYVIGRRSDFIAGYLGQTALKTTKFLDSTLPKKDPKTGLMTGGKIIILDEIYSFGSGTSSHSGGGDRDSFSKEFIDTLNQWLSENSNQLVICCGYKEDVAECFFAVNKGLERRFPFRYDIEPYNSEELMQIFVTKVKKCNWVLNVDMEELKTFFSDKASDFPNFGGDIENLLLKCKITHSHRVLFAKHERKSLNMEDIKTGFELFLKHKAPNDIDMDIDLTYDGIYMDV